LLDHGFDHHADQCSARRVDTENAGDAGVTPLTQPGG
jgi:hypothetical protein